MAESIRWRRVLAAAFLLALTWGCMFDGGGSDTETLTGQVLTAEGTPAAGARVKLIPATYDPSNPDPALIRTALTDSKGHYRFAKPASGDAFNLLAESGSLDQGIFQAGLPVDSVPASVTLSKSRVFFISLHGDAYAQADSGKAWFPGTDLFVRCDGDTATKMGSVPRGISDMVIESRAGWRHDYSVTNPGDTLVIKANRLEVQCLPY